MNEPKIKPLAELSAADLERRQQEIQFIGTQYAMNGCEPPDELTEEYEAIMKEIDRRTAPSKGN